MIYAWSNWAAGSNLPRPTTICSDCRCCSGSGRTAKVQGIVKQARDALLGGPVTMIDEGIDVSEDRVQRMGELLANVIM